MRIARRSSGEYPYERACERHGYRPAPGPFSCLHAAIPRAAISLPSILTLTESRVINGDLGARLLASSAFNVGTEVNRSRGEGSEFTFVVADLAW